MAPPEPNHDIYNTYNNLSKNGFSDGPLIDLTEITSQRQIRPELRILDSGEMDGHNPEILLGMLKQAMPLYYRLLSCNIVRKQGNNLFKAGKYNEAITRYEQAARKIIGKDMNFPIVTTERNIKQPRYMQLAWQEQMDLVACCNNIAISFIKLQELKAGINWCLEAQILYKNQRFNHPNFSWKDLNLSIVEYYTGQQKMHLRLSQVFTELRNTSCAVHHALSVTNILRKAPSDKAPTEMQVLVESAKLAEVAQFRHPDYSIKDRTEVKYPDLQVRGSWRKIKIENPKSRPASQLGQGCFAYKGHLYVYGGQGSEVKRSREFWYIELPKKKNGKAGPWRQLPDIPIDPRIQDTVGIPVQVYEHKAYLFSGSQTLKIFDLIKRKWSTKTTVLRGKEWPYMGNKSSGHTVEILDGKLYVFGGQDGPDSLGSNIFMALDLKSFEWIWISGHPKPTQTWDEPMLRVHHGSWSDPVRKKIYIHNGNANQMAQWIREPRGQHSSAADHTYEDTWSYNTATKQWTREITSGNYPCPRTEHSLVFNKCINNSKGGVICFGGYSAVSRTIVRDKNQDFTFAYFADTFLLDPESMVWRQVLTHGFPTYRAQHRLVVDSQQNRTFLFGGYTNSDFVQSQDGISKSFNDIWELRIDVPGGGIYPGFDWQEDEKSAAKGPWKECFNCATVGGALKVCGGTCKGKVSYCDKKCGDEKWQEHQKTHGCQNPLALEAERRDRERDEAAANAANSKAKKEENMKAKDRSKR